MTDDDEKFIKAIKDLVNTQFAIQYALEPLLADLQKFHEIATKSPLKFEDAGDIMLLMSAIFKHIPIALELITQNNAIWLDVLREQQAMQQKQDSS